MKINEIEYGHFNKPSIAEIATLQNLTLAGNYDGYDIYSTSQNGHHYYLILDENNPITYMGFIATDRSYLRELYVKEKFRRLGIMSILILFITKQLHQPLLIAFDEIVTDDSRKLIRQLHRRNKIKVINKETGINYTPDDLAILFKNIDDDNVELIIESRQRLRISNSCYEIRNGTDLD